MILCRNDLLANISGSQLEDLSLSHGYFPGLRIQPYVTECTDNPLGKGAVFRERSDS